MKIEIGKLHDRRRELEADIITALQTALGNKTINLEDTEQEFEDDANNTIVKVDKDNVYTDGITGEYPLTDLSINDALYILGLVIDMQIVKQLNKKD